MNPDELEAHASELARLADTAAEAVRAINHATITGPALPAPVVYDVIGSLRRLGYGLHQATGQLASRLTASAEVYDLYESDGDNPMQQIAIATNALEGASDHANAVGLLLDGAQAAIAYQGYRD